MMAALPAEARDKIMDADGTDYWIETAYKEYYGNPNFKGNPGIDECLWLYARCLGALDLTDVVLIIDSILAERHYG